MSEIKLFSIKNDVKQLIPSEVLLEKELQNLIEIIWKNSLVFDF